MTESTSTTVRDRVWDATLRLGVEGERFTTGDVLEAADLGESERRTAQRTLKAMVDLGWLYDHRNSWSVCEIHTPRLVAPKVGHHLSD